MAMATVLFHRLRQSHSSQRPNVQFHLFEPQPGLQPMVQNVKAAIQKLGATVQLNQAAVSVRDGNTTFWLAHNTEAASMNHQTSNGLHLKRRINIKMIDVEAYMSKAFTPDDLIFFKLDIESEELRLLPHMLRQPNGPMCRISYWQIEWHLWNGVTYKPENIKLRRTLEEQLDRQCAGVALTPSRVVDHEERYSAHDIPK